MEKFVKGYVVIIPFPFCDLSNTKRRPAFVISDLENREIILCQITSKMNQDKHAILLTTENFMNGALPVVSYIRPTKIFTADKNIVLRKVGNVKDVVYKLVIEKIIDIIS